MSASKSLSLYLITFNCGRELINPDIFASRLFDGLPAAKTSTTQPPVPDLIVLNLQEIAPIGYAFLGGSFVTPYFNRFRTAVDIASKQRVSDISTSAGDSDYDEIFYVNVRAESIGLTAIMVFVRSDLVGQIGDLMTASVGVGVQEMGNKGAVGVRLNWKLDESTPSSNEDGDGNDSQHISMTFVSAHLAPMEDELERRNQDYKDIVQGLVFVSDLKSSNGNTSSSDRTATIRDEGDEDVPLIQGVPKHTSNPTGMYTPNTHLFFAGDLNYRTSSTPPSKSGSDESSFPKPRSQSETTGSTAHWSSLLEKDQLSHALKDRHTLHGLTESPINFPPTYKYKFPTDDKDLDVITESDFEKSGHYSFASHRWPSWCDRILFSSSTSSSSSSSSTTTTNNKNPTIKVDSYTALPLFRTSDHRPVALSIQIPLIPVHNPSFAASQPVALDANYKSARTAARRKEIVVGVSSYLTLTREGNVVGVAGLIMVLAGFWLIKGLAL